LFAIHAEDQGTPESPLIARVPATSPLLGRGRDLSSPPFPGRPWPHRCCSCPRRMSVPAPPAFQLAHTIDPLPLFPPPDLASHAGRVDRLLQEGTRLLHRIGALERRPRAWRPDGAETAEEARRDEVPGQGHAHPPGPELDRSAPRRRVLLE